MHLKLTLPLVLTALIGLAPEAALGKPKAASKGAKAPAEAADKATTPPAGKEDPRAAAKKDGGSGDKESSSTEEAEGTKAAEATEPTAVDAPAAPAPAKAEPKELASPSEESLASSSEAGEKEAPSEPAGDDSSKAEASVAGGLSATAQPELDQANPSGSDSPGRQNTALEARLQGGMFARSFSYTDNETENRDFAGNGPTVGVRALVYPAAFALDGVPALFGLSLGYSREFPPETSDASSVTLTSASQEWYAGLRARIPIAAHELGVELRYAHQSYELTGDENAGPCAWNSISGDRGLAPGVSCLFPDVAYGAIEPLIEARANFAPFFVAAQAGVRIVLDSGELRSPYWFPDAAGAAAEFGVRAGLRIAPNLDAVIGGDVRHYGFDFNPLPSARLSASAPGPVAGGAIDRYLSAWLGLTYSLPGRS